MKGFKYNLLFGILAISIIFSISIFEKNVVFAEEGEKFMSDPNYVYLIEGSSGIIHRLKINDRQNISKNVTEVVTENRMIDGRSFGGLTNSGYYEIWKKTGYRPGQLNALGLSQDGRYAYVIATTPNLVAKSKKRSALAILRYDATKKGWEILSTVDEWGDNAPNSANRYYTKGGYDPVSHSYVFSTTEFLNNSDFGPADGTKYTERFWAYNIDDHSFKSIGYIVPNFMKELGLSQDKVKQTKVVLNGDFSIGSNGELTVLFNVVNTTDRKNMKSVAFRYRVPYKTFKKALELGNAEHEIIGNIDFRAEIPVNFSGAAIDTDGNMFISNGKNVWGLVPNNYYTMPKLHGRTAPGSNWTDMATVPGHFVMVKYEDEQGNKIKDEVFSKSNMLNDTPYDTTKDKPKEITFNGKTYILKEVKQGSDKEKDVLYDRDYFVTYVYQEVKITKFVDENNKTIELKDAIKDKGFVVNGDEPKEIEKDGVKYYRTKTPATEKGDTKTFFYAKEKLTKWVDEDGNVLKPEDTGVDYNNDNPDTLEKDGVTYYKKEKTEADGTRTYIYSKEKTTKFVDEDNKTVELADKNVAKEFVDGEEVITLEDGTKYYKSATNPTIEGSEKTVYYTKEKTTKWVTDDKTPIDLKNAEKGKDYGNGPETLTKDGVKYYLTETKDPVNGVKVYVYSKEKTTKFVDENNQEFEVKDLIKQKDFVLDNDTTNAPDEVVKNGVKYYKSATKPTINGSEKTFYYKKEVTTKWVTDDETPVDLKDAEKGKDYGNGPETLTKDGVTYYLTETKDPVNGLKVYVYSKEKTTKFVDENNQEFEVKDLIKQKDFVLDNDTTNAPDEVVKNGVKYYKSATKPTINGSEKTFYYKKEVTTKWVTDDETPVDLKDAEKGKDYGNGPETLTKDGVTYYLTETKDPVNGVKVYVYSKEKTTKFVDEDDNTKELEVEVKDKEFVDGKPVITLADGTKYYQSATEPTIKGTEKTIYYTKEKVTKWIDVTDPNNSELMPKTEVEKGKDYIDAGTLPKGYVFVGTEIINGETVHKYVKERTTKFVDENNKTLELADKNVGKEFVDGKEIITLKDGTKYYKSETEPTITGREKTVYYKKEVTTKWVTDDEIPVDLKDAEKGKDYGNGPETLTKDGVKYYLQPNPVEKDGVKTYVYSKEKTTKWITDDKTPVDLKDAEKGKDYGNGPETLTKDGVTYYLTETKDPVNGVKVYVYSKEKTTNWVDEKGNPLKEKITDKSTKDEGKIPNYEFVKTTTDKNGNVTHHFKKIVEKVYKATHKFVSAELGKDLPQAVNDLLPKDKVDLKNNTEVKPNLPEKLEVRVEGGKWVFKGYDKQTALIKNKDEHFIGKWEFIKDDVVVVEKESQYITRWVDENGEDLKTSVVGKTTEKKGEIVSYKFVKTTTDKLGNVTHHFEKVVKKANKKTAINLPKTGDGLNSNTYAKIAFVIGSILLICGIKFRKK